MKNNVRFVAVQLDGEDGLVVTFSDRTTGAYVVEELIELRPYRETLKETKGRIVPTEGPIYDIPRAKASATRTKRQEDLHPCH